MKLHPRLSRAAIELVTRFETLHPTAQRTADGGWTVGYGHIRSAREGACVSQEDAEALLLYDLAHAAEAVDAALFAPVTQRQFEALSAFCFNIGIENFRRSSALARVNAGADLEAADEIERWRRAELGAGAQVVDALVRRRAAEKAHFLGLPDGFSKSPRAVLRPLSDADAVDHAASPEPAGSQPAAAFGPSATLDAANNVQARLRELVPDPEPPPFEAEPPTPHPIDALTAEPPAPETVEPEAVETEALETETAEPSAPEPPPLGPVLSSPPPYVAPPPPPVAPTARVSAANDAAASPSSAEPLPAATPSGTVGSEGGRAHALATRARLRLARALASATRLGLTARGRWLLLTAVGACLLVAALVVILSGRPGLTSLAAGALGVLVMIPGIYGLLGPRPSAG